MNHNKNEDNPQTDNSPKYNTIILYKLDSKIWINIR